MNHGRLVVSFFDWITQRSVSRDQFDGVGHGKTVVFITNTIVATVVEVESGSASLDTSLAAEIQKRLRNQRCCIVQRLLKPSSQRRCS